MAQRVPVRHICRQMIDKIVVLGRSPGVCFWSCSLRPFPSIITGMGHGIDLVDVSDIFVSELGGVWISNENDPQGGEVSKEDAKLDLCGFARVRLGEQQEFRCDGHLRAWLVRVAF